MGPCVRIESSASPAKGESRRIGGGVITTARATAIDRGGPRPRSRLTGFATPYPEVKAAVANGPVTEKQVLSKKSIATSG
jgi:hypothetical protein